MCDFCLCVSTNKLNMYVNRRKMENVINVGVYSQICEKVIFVMQDENTNNIDQL